MDSLRLFVLAASCDSQTDENTFVQKFIELVNEAAPKRTIRFSKESPTDGRLAEAVLVFGETAGYIIYEGKAERRNARPPVWLNKIARVLGTALSARTKVRQVFQMEGQFPSWRDQYDALFEGFPMALWEIDFSQARHRLGELYTQGVTDLRAYLARTPEEFEALVGLIHVVRVNRAALNDYKAPGLESFLRLAPERMTNHPANVVLEELIALAEGQQHFAWEGRGNVGKGQLRDQTVSWIVLPGSEASFERVILSVTDVTEEKRVAEALRQSEERFSLAVRGANDGIWDWNLRQERIFYSSRWKMMLGYSDDEIKDSPDEWIGRIHPEDVARVREELDAHLAGQTEYFASEHRLWTRYGTYRWFLMRGVAVSEAGQKPYRIAGSLTDINPRKQIEERLVHDAMHDPLTALPNRAYFLDQLRRCIERSKRHADYQAAVLFLDVDRFRIINESLGHTSGDRMLITMAGRLNRLLRAGDSVARFSGDDFVVLLEDINGLGDATRIANRIESDMSLPFNLKGQEIFSTVSIGIALIHGNYQSAEDVLRDAEVAMNRAKTNGRAHYQIFDPKMHAQSMTMLQLEVDIRRAIEREEFVLFYQPIVSLISGKITALEALVRWRNPDRGLILPADFIPMAEETGLIQQLGEWIFRSSCQQARIWQDQGFDGLRVSINISARQFQDQNLVALVGGILEETGVNPHNIELEITESTAMVDLDLTVRILHEMTAMGVHFSIDDFGSSYSSLGYLKRFPVQTLKIDLSFIKDIPGSVDDAAITTAMIAMGHILELGVVSEGVETQEQLDFLVSRRCDEAQGFFLSSAMTADEVTRLLFSGRSLMPIDQGLVPM